MPSAMSLFVRIFGDSAQFREDMAQDKASVDSFLAGLGTKDLTVQVQAEQAQAELDAIKAKVAAMKDAVIHVGATDMDAMAKLDELEAKEKEIKRLEVEISATTVRADEQIDEMKARIDELKHEVIHLDANSAEAKEKLVEIKELEDAIHRRTIRVDAETTAALRKIGELEADMKTLEDDHVKILLEDTAAKEKLAEVRTDIGTLTDKVLELKLDDKDLPAKLQEIRLEMDRIREVTSTIHLKDTDAQLRLDELIAKEDALRDKTIRVNVEPTLPGGGSSAAAAAGGRGRTLAAILGALSPLLAPIGASVAGGAGGLGAIFTAAIPGVVGFATVAKSNLTDVTAAEKKLQVAQKAVNNAVAQVHAAKTYQQWLVATQNLNKAQGTLSDLQKQLGPDMMKAVDALKQWQTYWQQYVASFRPQVLTDFIDGTRTLKTLLTDMHPVIQAAGKAIDTLLKDMNSSLSGNGAKQFFQWMASTAGPAILSIGKSTGNIFKGLAELAKDFTPLMGPMEQGWNKMTASFANWAANLGKTKGFEEFIAYVKANGPLLLSTIGQLLKVIGNVAVIVAPLGTGLLSLINSLAKVVNTLLPILQKAISAFGKIFGPILLTPGQIEKQWNPLPKWFSKLWTTIHDTGVRIWGNLAKYLRSQTSQNVSQLEGYWRTFHANITKLWSGIVKWFDSLWSGVINGVKAFGKDFNANIQGIGTDISDYFAGLGTDALDWGKNIIANLITGIESMGSKLKTAAANAAKHIANNLGFHSPAKEGPGADADKWAPNLMAMFTDGIQAGIPKLRATLNTVLVPPGAANMMTVGGMMSAGASGHTFNLNYSINGPVYGVDDLHAAIREGVYQHAVPAVLDAVKPTARAMGVSS